MDKEIDSAEARRITKKVMAIFGGVLMVVGGLTLVGGIYNYTQAVISNNWSSTSGVILESKLNMDERFSSHSGMQTRERVYSPSILYQYKVDGEQYTGNRIRFAAIGGSDINASRSYVDRFPVNKKVAVWYSPFNHNQAVLVKGVEKVTNLGTLVAGIAFMLVGFIFYKLRNVYANSIPD